MWIMLAVLFCMIYVLGPIIPLAWLMEMKTRYSDYLVCSECTHWTISVPVYYLGLTESKVNLNVLTTNHCGRFVNYSYILKAEYEPAAVWKRNAGRRYTTQSMTSPRDEDLKNRGSISGRDKYKVIKKSLYTWWLNTEIKIIAVHPAVCRQV
jgi:hypothetical protein